MPSVPEFLLRRLYVPGSLRPAGTGFSFELHNSLAPATITSLSLGLDGRHVPAGLVTISTPQASIPVTEITSQAPFTLAVGLTVRVEVMDHTPGQGRLTVCAESAELGTLQFTINAAKSRSGQNPNPIQRAWQVLVNACRRFRARHDPLHPRFHFSPPANWMNDPNGLIQWQGVYHLFYQHNPYQPAWGNIHWGHAISHNLVHWHHFPPALKPTPGGADPDGCFSGCTVDDNGTPTILYTGVFPESQCLARGSSDLRTWVKHPGNPVIPAPPPALNAEGFRDPFVWRDAAGWNMVLGSGTRTQGGMVLLYRSHNLLEWEYHGVLLAGGGSLPGKMWECPQLFKLDDTWVLILSIMENGPGHTICLTGEYREDRFISRHRQTLDFGSPAFYAPQTFPDASGRRILFGWLPEERPESELRKAGWAGILSLPRLLSLSADGRLLQTPLPELACLRGVHVEFHHCSINTTPFFPLKNPCGGKIEILAEIEPGAEADVILELSPRSGRAQARITCSIREAALLVETAYPARVSRMPLNPIPGKPLLLHVFLDASVLEVFTSGKALTRRFYPPDSRGLNIQFTATGNNAVIRKLDVWQLHAMHA